MFHSFVPLFLFCNFLFCNFCSSIFVPLTFLHLHLGSPSPNGQESPPIFVPLFLFCNFLFCYFCFTIFVPLTFLHLHLGSASPNGQESPPIFVLPDRCYPFKVQTLSEQSLWNIPFYTHLIYVPQFLFCYFCSAIFVPQFFVLLFLFHYFCSTDIFALALGVPITQWPRVPINFCSAIFVPLTFCTCTYQFLFLNFCSADLFALALTNFCSAIFVLLPFLHLHLGSPSPNGQESPPIFVLQFLFH